VICGVINKKEGIMSTNSWIIESKFTFSNIDKAFEAIKSNSYNYEYVDLDKSENIFEAFEKWGILLNLEESDTFNVISTGDCLGDESELFNIISPYINKGGFIKLGAEEGEIVTYNFNGKSCKAESSKVGIDGNYDIVFINTNEIKINDAIKNLDKSFDVIVKVNTCKVLFNDKVCAHIIKSKNGEKLFKKFQFEQKEVIEAKVADGDLQKIDNLLKEAKSIILVKFSEIISLNDFMNNYEIDWEAFNNAKKEQGIYWESYISLCEENGIYCIPQDGYYNKNNDEPVLNLDY
jgi:hypothetical protein